MENSQTLAEYWAEFYTNSKLADDPQHIRALKEGFGADIKLGYVSISYHADSIHEAIQFSDGSIYVLGMGPYKSDSVTTFKGER